MTDRERAMLDSMREMEDALTMLEEKVQQEQKVFGKSYQHTIIDRAICRAVYVLLDWAIRKERSDKRK